MEVVPGESEAPIKSVLYYDDSSWVCQVKVFIKIYLTREDIIHINEASASRA